MTFHDFVENHGDDRGKVKAYDFKDYGSLGENVLKFFSMKCFTTVLVLFFKRDFVYFFNNEEL